MRMTKKILWILVSSLMVLSLVLASCGPGEEEEEEEGLLAPEVPKYGGTLNYLSFDPMGFDPYYTFMVQCSTLYLCNEELLMGDWKQTPQGNGKAGIGGFVGYASRLAGQLCESWSMPDDETLLFNIRKGVHWWDKPPVNGREYTAEDAAWAINHLWEAPTGAHQMIVAPGERILGAKALDKYTLEVKVHPEAQGLQVIYTGSWLFHYPKEVVDTYGDMKDWKNVCGTGAYILTDYITSSSLTYQKNPDYWQYDPLHPENKLPYLDTIRGLIIPDQSTQLASFRTGQVDLSPMALNYEQGELLLDQCPDLKYTTVPGFANHLYFRVDKPELPWDDLRVRQAMTLVINKQELIDTYYHGYADLQAAIYPPDKAWEPFYTPLEEMPTEPTTPDSRCSIQELFNYTPENLTKAKQLLEEAGYPNGFKCAIISSNPGDTDFLSVIKEYFAKVNVELEIQQLEGSIVAGMRRSRSYEEGIYTGAPDAAFPYDMHSTRKESFDCFSYYEHPVTRAAYEEQRQYVCKDDAKYAATLKAVVPFILEQCVGIWCPVPRTYRMWWPWVQNYSGEWGLGCDDTGLHLYYMWTDQALKKSMGY